MNTIAAFNQDVILVVWGEKLDPHRLAGCDPRPLEQVLLELAQPSLGRADQIVDAAGAHALERKLGGHAVVHQPGPAGAAPAPFDTIEKLFQRRGLVLITGIDFVSDGQSVGRDDQRDDDLRVVGTMIAAVAETAFGVGLWQRRIGLENRCWSGHRAARRTGLQTARPIVA